MQNVLGFRLKLMCFLLLLLLLQAQILSHAEPIKSVCTALSRFVSEFPGHVLFSHAEILPVQKAAFCHFSLVSRWTPQCTGCSALIHPSSIQKALHRLPWEQAKCEVGSHMVGLAITNIIVNDMSVCVTFFRALKLIYDTVTKDVSLETAT